MDLIILYFLSSALKRITANLSGCFLQELDFNLTAFFKITFRFFIRSLFTFKHLVCLTEREPPATTKLYAFVGNGAVIEEFPCKEKNPKFRNK